MKSKRRLKKIPINYLKIIIYKYNINKIRIKYFKNMIRDIHYWDNTGLLDGLNEKQQDMLAFAYDKLYNQLGKMSVSELNIMFPNRSLESINHTKVKVAYLSFPILRRLFSLNDNYLKLKKNNIEAFVAKFVKDLAIDLDKFGIFPTISDVDVEANFCADFTEKYDKILTLNIMIADSGMLDGLTMMADSKITDLFTPNVSQRIDDEVKDEKEN